MIHRWAIRRLHQAQLGLMVCYSQKAKAVVKPEDVTIRNRDSLWFQRQNRDMEDSTNIHWGYKTNHEYYTGDIVGSLTNINDHGIFGYRRIGEIPQTKPF